MIPGHTVTGTGTVTPTLAGTGLAAELTIDGYSDAELGELDITWQVGDEAGEGLQETFTPDDSDVAVPVTVTIDFPSASTGTMNQAVTLEGLEVELTQVLP
jgi:alternate signal-mediated exported protein